MLALARAFMQRPRLLLLDEPSLGLAPLLVTEIFRIIKELNEHEGLTVLVVEQNAHIALQLAQTRTCSRSAASRSPGRARSCEQHESDPPELPGLLMLRASRRRKTAVSTGVSLPVVALLVAARVFLVIGSCRSSIFAQQTVAGLAQGAIFGSLALALVLIYRATEVINFAQGELAMATTYIAYQLILWGTHLLARVLR